MQHLRQAAVALAGKSQVGDHVAVRHGGGAFHAVLQLAHIARPVTAAQHPHRCRAELGGSRVVAVEAVEEMFGHGRDVFAALAQWRQLDADHVDAVVQVGAELARLHHALQIPVGGEDQAHIHLHRRRTPDALELALLQHAQQLGLKRGRDVTDLVQEQGAAVRHLEAALALPLGAGERAFFVPEEFALQQRLGQRRAVDADKGFALARRQAVDGSGDHFLAGAALAAQQHRRARWRHLVHLVKHLQHGRRGAHHVFDLVAALERLGHAAHLVLHAVVGRADTAVQEQRLAHQRGHHLEQLQVVTEVAAGLGIQVIDRQHTHRAPVRPDRRGQHGNTGTRALVGATGAVQEQRFGAQIGHRKGHARGVDATDDALARQELQPLAFFVAQTDRAQTVQLGRARFGQHDKGTAPVHCLQQIVKGFTKSFVDVERGRERLADLVDHVQFAPRCGHLCVHHHGALRVGARQDLIQGSAVPGVAGEHQRRDF